jgi:hypothetical protein
MKLKNKVLDLFLWHPILVLALGTLGFVGKAAAPLVEQLDSGGGGGRGSLLFFFSAFLGLMGHPLQAGALKWSYQVTGL